MESNTSKRIYVIILFFFVGIFLMFANKAILTYYGFPSYTLIGAGQALTILTTLSYAKRKGYVRYPDVTVESTRNIFPIPAIYLFNMISGLGATKGLTIPMFSALRRLAIPLTVTLEFFILKITPTNSILFSIVVILSGSFIAAAEDLSFNLVGYLMMLSYVSFGSVEGVFIKKQITDSETFGKVGVLFYCALYSFLPMVLIAAFTGELTAAINFEKWTDVYFLACFMASCMLGLCQFFLYVQCMELNSALMAQIVSTFRSVAITYIGIYVGDYIFNVINFIGLNIVMMGGIMYTYISFKQKGNKVIKDISTPGESLLEKKWQIPEDVENPRKFENE